jgi:hypothetical protein
LGVEVRAKRGLGGVEKSDADDCRLRRHEGNEGLKVGRWEGAKG